MDITAVDIHRLASNSEKLSKIIISNAMTAAWITRFLRRLTQPLELSILFQTSYTFNISADFIGEITDLLRAHPEMDFEIEVPKRKLIVSNFELCY